jgi:hypothetical protein
MYRSTNRASFLGKPGASSLAKAYGKLVAIEIVVKDELGPAATASHGHDVPGLLVALAKARELAPHFVPKAAMTGKVAKLSSLLSGMTCTGKQGARMPVPAVNYPYMRYVLHENDGTHPTDTKEAHIADVGATADEVIDLLINAYKISP